MNLGIEARLLKLQLRRKKLRYLRHP